MWKLEETGTTKKGKYKNQGTTQIWGLENLVRCTG